MNYSYGGSVKAFNMTDMIVNFRHRWLVHDTVKLGIEGRETDVKMK